MKEIFREGAFHFVNPTDLSNRCGITGQGLTYRYQVRLFAESLDGRGFILDNRAINLYWIWKYSSPEPKALPSCEAMAQQGCMDFVKLAKLQNVDLDGCEIRIFGGTHSAVTNRWGKGHWSAAGAVDPADNLQPVVEEIEEGDPILAHLREVVYGIERPSSLTAAATFAGVLFLTVVVPVVLAMFA
jgi:hypothetical protein